MLRKTVISQQAECSLHVHDHIEKSREVLDQPPLGSLITPGCPTEIDSELHRVLAADGRLGVVQKR
jgi:hypothetical protein